MRALAWLVLLSAMAAAPARAAEPGTLSARIDGQLWTASQVSCATFRFGQQPALNLAAQRDGPPSTRISFNLVLPGEDDFVHRFDLAPAPARTSHGNFLLNVMAPYAPDTRFLFINGTVVIERYDQARNTISGRFDGRATNVAGTRSMDIRDGRFTDIPVLTGR